jgi:hypothetical protein
MGKLFVILQEYEKSYTPKRGEFKGIEQTKKAYLVATAEPNNYILSEYTDADESNYDEFIDGKYYEKLTSGTSYGSPEHLINKFIKITDLTPSEDILTALQWAKRLEQQYLSKQQWLDTWLPALTVKPEKEKDFTIKDE